MMTGQIRALMLKTRNRRLEELASLRTFMSALESAAVRALEP